MIFYLLGYPVDHSVSPYMHNVAFKELGLAHHYSTLSVLKEHLGETIESKIRVDSFGGANVTIPHKIEIIKYMDELVDSARKAGAVNTIEWKDGILYGHNTDALGGIRALKENYGSLSDAKVVLLGTGGAARSLAAEIAPKVDELVILNRTIDKAKKLSEEHGENVSFGSLEEQQVIETADILINTTPVGMFPKTGESLVKPEYLHSGLLVYDIVYNPLKTKLLIDAEKAGSRTLGGLWMLVYQGVESFRIWTGIEPNAETMYNSALKALEETKH